MAQQKIGVCGEVKDKLSILKRNLYPKVRVSNSDLISQLIDEHYELSSLKVIHDPSKSRA